MTILQREAQIKAIEAIITNGKCKNVFALGNKLRRLKLELIAEENRIKFENFLAQ